MLYFILVVHLSGAASLLLPDHREGNFVEWSRQQKRPAQMQGLRSLSHTRSLSSCPFFNRSKIRARFDRVRVWESPSGSTALRVALPQQSKAGQIDAGIQQEAPRSQQIVLGHSRKKFVPFRPDFFSSEPVQLAGSCCAVVVQTRAALESGAPRPLKREAVASSDSEKSPRVHNASFCRRLMGWLG